MRLLRRKQDSDRCELVTFGTDNLPRYAILSHTWTDGQEVTYDELVAGAGNDKAGYAKIRFCGERAADDGIQYFWVDTCCIDKNSSAELSESINSMYRWYQQADVCYAYIDDWPPELAWADLASVLPANDMQSYKELRSERIVNEDHEPGEDTSAESTSSELQIGVDEVQMHESIKGQEMIPEPAALQDNTSQAKIAKNFVQAGPKNDARPRSAQSLAPAQSNNNPSAAISPLRWFTRGWTLQELIAPKKMEFFDGNRKSRGMKSDPLIVESLSRITGIAPDVLTDSSEDSLRRTCYGQRMSWAAYRHTSRKEDIAYCLLGIFQVNVPLLYGEGVKAFARLQEEILASSTDLSLLAWTQAREDPQQYRGIFSYHPREFQGLRQCQLDHSQFSTQDEVIMTNKGARIETSLFGVKYEDDDKSLANLDHCLSLGCYVSGKYLQGIVLKKMKDFYVRAVPSDLMRMNFELRRAEPRTIYIARDFAGSSNLDFDRRTTAGIKVKLRAPSPYALEVVESWPQGYFDPFAKTFVVGNLAFFVGYLIIHIKHFTQKDVKYGGRLVDSFMAVVSKGGHSNITVNVFCGAQVQKFKADLSLTWKMDSTTARRKLANRLAHLRQNLEPITTVHDYNTNSLLRIDGEIVDGMPKLTAEESGRRFAAKAVRLSIVNVGDHKCTSSQGEQQDRRPAAVQMPPRGNGGSGSSGGRVISRQKDRRGIIVGTVARAF